MIKKKTTESSTKEKKDKRKVDFEPFIKTVIYKETMENIMSKSIKSMRKRIGPDLLLA